MDANGGVPRAQMVDLSAEPAYGDGRPRISLVLSGGHDSATAERVRNDAHRHLSQLASEYEILWVTPATLSPEGVAVDLTAVDADPRQHRVPERVSRGSTLQAVCQAARYELVVIAPDCDRPDFLELEQLLAQHGKAELLVSVRHRPRTGVLSIVLDPVAGLLRYVTHTSGVVAAIETWRVLPAGRLAELAPESASQFADDEMLARARLQGLPLTELHHWGESAPLLRQRRTLRQRRDEWSDLVRFWWRRAMFAGAPLSPPGPGDRFWPLLGLLVLIAVGMLFPSLSAPLHEPDEGRHAEIAREMWETGDWLAPKFCLTPYLEKPPMLYWLCQLSIACLGETIQAVRLAPAVCALLTVLATFVLGRRLIGTWGAWIGALILTLSLGFATCGRFLILESTLTLFVVTSLLTGYIAGWQARLPGPWWFVSAVLCGLGVLTKGPVAVLLVAPPLFLCAWLSSPARRLTWRHWAGYLLIVVLIAAPWYLAIAIRRPEFFRYFFLEQNIQRFLVGHKHGQPIWFFIPVLLIGLLPWTLLLAPLSKFLVSRAPEDRAQRPPVLGFLVIWSAWNFGFFSLSAGKLPYYILACIPALTLLMGDFLARVHSLWGDLTPLRAAVQARFVRGAQLLTVAAFGVAPVVWLMSLVSLSTCLAWSAFWVTAGLCVRLWAPCWSPRLLWGVFCSLAFLGVAQLTQRVLPAWQERYAILSPQQTDDADLEDPRNSVACIGGSWGSIWYYTDREDITFLEAPEPEPLEKLVRQGRGTLLLVNRSIPDAAVQRALPEDYTLNTVYKTRRARLLRVESTAAPRQIAAAGLSAAVRKLR